MTFMRQVSAVVVKCHNDEILAPTNNLFGSFLKTKVCTMNERSQKAHQSNLNTATHHYRRRTKDERIRQQLLYDLYGHEMGHLENETSQPKSNSIQFLMNGVLDSLDRGDKVLLRKLVDKWGDIVGPELQPHAAPRYIKNQILYVEVNHASWLFQIERFLKNEIESLVRTHSDSRINSVRFIPGGRTRNYNRQR